MAGLPPGDPQLVSMIVNHLKTQGLFDQFRRDCLADVDTKPAYLNLRQRVDNFVSNHLSNHTWSPHLNKNQLRNNIRQLVLQSGMLEQGVDRIVAQVVDPKIHHIFRPQVEKVVREFLSPGSLGEEQEPFPVLGEEKPDQTAAPPGSSMAPPTSTPPTSATSDAMSILDTISSLNQEASAWGAGDKSGRKEASEGGPEKEHSLEGAEGGEQDMSLVEEEEDGERVGEGQEEDRDAEEKLGLEGQGVEAEVEDNEEGMILKEEDDEEEEEDDEEEEEEGQVEEAKQDTEGQEVEESAEGTGEEWKDKAARRPKEEVSMDTDANRSPSEKHHIRQKARERLKEEYSLEDSDLEGLSDITVSSVHTSDLSSLEEESDEDPQLSDTTEEGEITSEDELKVESKPVAAEEESSKEHKRRGGRQAYVHKPFLYSRYYSDSDDEVTVEQRRRNAAKDKEERLLKRQQNREKLEEKRRQKVTLQEEHEDSKMELSSPSEEAQGPAGKEARKEKKVLEKKVAISRRRKRQRKDDDIGNKRRGETEELLKKTGEEMKAGSSRGQKPRFARRTSESSVSEEGRRKRSVWVPEEASACWDHKKLWDKSRTHSFILDLEQGSEELLRQRAGGKFDRLPRRESSDALKHPRAGERGVPDERGKQKLKAERGGGGRGGGEARIEDSLQKDGGHVTKPPTDDKAERKGKNRGERRSSVPGRESRTSVSEESAKRPKATCSANVPKMEKTKGEKTPAKSQSKLDSTGSSEDRSDVEPGSEGGRKKDRRPRDALKRLKGPSEDRHVDTPKLRVDGKDALKPGEKTKADHEKPSSDTDADRKARDAVEPKVKPTPAEKVKADHEKTGSDTDADRKARDVVEPKVKPAPAEKVKADHEKTGSDTDTDRKARDVVEPKVKPTPVEKVKADHEKTGSDTDTDRKARDAVEPKVKPTPAEKAKAKSREEPKVSTVVKGEKKAPSPEGKGKGLKTGSRLDSSKEKKREGSVKEERRASEETPLEKIKESNEDKMPADEKDTGCVVENQGEITPESLGASVKPCLQGEMSTDSEIVVPPVAPPAAAPAAVVGDDLDALSDITPEPEDNEVAVPMDIDGGGGVPASADAQGPPRPAGTGADAGLAVEAAVSQGGYTAEERGEAANPDPGEAIRRSEITLQEADLKMKEAALTLLSMDPHMTAPELPSPLPQFPVETTPCPSQVAAVEGDLSKVTTEALQSESPTEEDQTPDGQPVRHDISSAGTEEMRVSDITPARVISPEEEEKHSGKQLEPVSENPLRTSDAAIDELGLTGEEVAAGPGEVEKMVEDQGDANDDLEKSDAGDRLLETKVEDVPPADAQDTTESVGGSSHEDLQSTLGHKDSQGLSDDCGLGTGELRKRGRRRSRQASTGEASATSQEAEFNDGGKCSSDRDVAEVPEDASSTEGEKRAEATETEEKDADEEPAKTESGGNRRGRRPRAAAKEMGKDEKKLDQEGEALGSVTDDEQTKEVGKTQTGQQAELIKQDCNASDAGGQEDERGSDPSETEDRPEVGVTRQAVPKPAGVQSNSTGKTSQPEREDMEQGSEQPVEQRESEEVKETRSRRGRPSQSGGSMPQRDSGKLQKEESSERQVAGPRPESENEGESTEPKVRRRGRPSKSAAPSLREIGSSSKEREEEEGGDSLEEEPEKVEAPIRRGRSSGAQTKEGSKGNQQKKDEEENLSREKVVKEEEEKSGQRRGGRRGRPGRLAHLDKASKEQSEEKDDMENSDPKESADARRPGVKRKRSEDIEDSGEEEPTEESEGQDGSLTERIVRPPGDDSASQSDDQEDGKDESSNDNKTDNDDDKEPPQKRKPRRGRLSKGAGATAQDLDKAAAEKERKEDEPQEEEDEDEEETQRRATTRSASRLEAERNKPSKPSTRALSKKKEETIPATRGARGQTSGATKLGRKREASPPAVRTRGGQKAEEPPSKRTKR